MSARMFPMLLALLAACSGRGGGAGGGGGGSGGDDTAAGDEGGGDTGQPGPQGGCEPAREEPVDSFDVAAEGFDFTIRAVLLELAGEWSGTFEYGLPTKDTGAERPTTGIEASFGPDGFEGTAVYFEWKGEGEPEECPPEYHFKVPAEIATDDGALAEVFNAEWRARQVGRAEFDAAFDFGVVGGSAQPDDIPPAKWGDVDLVIHAAGAEGTWSGSASWELPAEGEGAPPQQVEVLGTFEMVQSR